MTALRTRHGPLAGQNPLTGSWLGNLLSMASAEDTLCILTSQTLGAIEGDVWFTCTGQLGVYPTHVGHHQEGLDCQICVGHVGHGEPKGPVRGTKLVFMKLR